MTLLLCIKAILVSHCHMILHQWAIIISQCTTHQWHQQEKEKNELLEWCAHGFGFLDSVEEKDVCAITFCFVCASWACEIMWDMLGTDRNDSKADKVMQASEWHICWLCDANKEPRYECPCIPGGWHSQIKPSWQCSSWNNDINNLLCKRHHGTFSSYPSLVKTIEGSCASQAKEQRKSYQ